MTLKALILSCSTGGGHNAAGRALLEELRRRDVDVEMTDAISLASPRAAQAVGGTYVGIAKRAPHAFGQLYRLGGFISSSRRKSPVYYANKLYADALYDHITENGFDTVFCPHLFPAETLTYLRRSRGLEISLYGVATDYTCSPFWEEIDLDRFFIPHESLRAEFEDKGIPSEKLLATGIPVSGRFCERSGRGTARAALSLPPQRRIYLVMTGSMGAGSTLSLVAALRAADPCAAVIIAAGTNDRLRAALAERFPADGLVFPLGFTDRIPLYMDACDVLLSKPGGLSTTEAAVKNVPLVHTSPIPGCETKNAAFFADRGLSVFADEPDEAATAAVALARDEARRAQMLAAQRETINARAAADICDVALALACKKETV